MQKDAEIYLKRWKDNNERLDYVLGRASERMGYFTKLPDGEFVDVVNETIENLQYIRLLHTCEHNRIPDTGEFYHLKIATEEFHKIHMIKYLRAMFNTTLEEAHKEINRVFDFSKAPIRANAFEKVQIMYLQMLKVETWEFMGVTLGFFAPNQLTGQREWNWRN